MINQTTHSSHRRSHRKAKAGSASNKTMAGKTNANETTARRDICQTVTDAIVKALEAGVKPWAQSWNTTGTGSALPLRHNGQRYRGINVLILWGAQFEGGYASPYWMTYKQATESGAQIRKGEKATQVVYYGTATKDAEPKIESESDGASLYRFLKTSSVFSADQIDGLPEHYYRKATSPKPAAERMPELDSMIAATGIQIAHGGNRAFYRQDIDRIQMPAAEAFRDTEFYYATLFHEATHATKHPARLDRSFGMQTWGDAGYAKEELVAELSAAFLGAEFGFGPEHLEDHASYINSWLSGLKEDKRLIFKLAAKAQEASDYITGRHQQAEQPPVGGAA